MLAGLKNAFLKIASPPRDTMKERIARLEHKIDTLEVALQRGRTTYLGNNRVLVKTVIRDFTLGYIVEADDKLLSPWFMLTGTFEDNVTDFFCNALKPDSHCLDIGANFGYYTCLMARVAYEGRTIAVEADERICDLAKDNLVVNGLHWGAALHAAAADQEGELTLYRRDRRSGNTSIINCDADFTNQMREAPAQPFQVRSVTVDALAGQMDGRVDFMKIDVEGAEPLVFRGARRCIAQNPGLTIVMEWSPNQIEAAGFDVPAFLAELAEMELKAWSLQMEPITWDALAVMPYATGIVLKRPV